MLFKISNMGHRLLKFRSSHLQVDHLPQEVCCAAILKPIPNHTGKKMPNSWIKLPKVIAAGEFTNSLSPAVRNRPWKHL